MGKILDTRKTFFGYEIRKKYAAINGVSIRINDNKSKISKFDISTRIVSFSPSTTLYFHHSFISFGIHPRH